MVTKKLFTKKSSNQPVHKSGLLEVRKQVRTSECFCLTIGENFSWNSHPDNLLNQINAGSICKQ